MLSLLFSSAVVVLYYLPVSAACYAVYGDLFITRNTDNILNILTPSIITTIVTIMITIHLIMGFIIVINPFCQELEQLLNIPLSKYQWQEIFGKPIYL